MPKKHKGKQPKYRKPTPKLQAILPIIPPSKTPNNKSTKKDTAKPWHQYIIPFIISIFGLIATTIGGNMLNDISPIAGYILFVISLCVFFGYWTWRFIGWTKKRHTSIRLIQSVITILVVGVIFVTSPYYKDYFIKTNSSIEMPTFVDESTQVFFSLGEGNRSFSFASTIGQLKNGAMVPFAAGEQPIFKVHIEGNKLYADTQIYTGGGNEPIILTNNAFDHKPAGWTIYGNNTALEIIRKDNLPMLVMYYDSPYHIIIEGIFVASNSIVIVPDTGGVIINPTEPVEYTAKRVFIHSLSDLFNSQRKYTIYGVK